MKAAIPPDLPINQALPELLLSLQKRRNVVLVAPPGAGKTTSVPLALMDEPWVRGTKIIMLAPRRLAARAAAARMSALLGEEVGARIGYRVRLDSKTSKATRVEVVTEGIFIRMILTDPELTGIGAVIFDEVHERNLDGDLALALALDAQSGLREDLRLLAMSATLDGARISTLMGDAPVIESLGRMFPVETHYVGSQVHSLLEVQAADVALRALSDGEGDALVFLPGVAELNRALSHLTTKARPQVSVCVLHGGLDPREQDLALAGAPQGRRKIVLATAIAETSLTLAGVRIVVDCGQTRRPAYEPDSGFTRLVTVRASRAACDQRRGRAGRTAPGQCYRLWEEAQTGSFPAFDRPEILDADLASLALTLAVWGVRDPTSLRWLDPPPQSAWREAVTALSDMGALDGEGRITSHGKELAAFGLPPRLANMIVTATALGFGFTAAHVAAVLSERGLGGASLDIASRLDALDRDRSPRANKARAQAVGWAKQAGARDSLDPYQAGRALALAFPERVAKARDRRGGFLLRGGRGGEIDASLAMSTAPFLAIGALQGNAAKSRILEAAALTRADIDALFAAQITQVTTTQYDKATGRILGRTQTRLGALILDETPARLDNEAVQNALYDAVLLHGLAILPWREKACLLRARLAWLHSKDPVAWADVSDDALLASAPDWLKSALVGVSSLEALNLTEALMSRLDWQAQQHLEHQAPHAFVTPAGITHTIDYAPEQGPTVGVRVQELFGLTRHPMLASDQIPLVFQLLSPAHRPIAVTSDVPGFWHGAWGDVRKEMKARYPRHVWPDDPSIALPTTKAKPRGT
jgi:ATP-dependent helicase HrpB